MATILMAWELGGGAGHCVNLLPIAHLLLQRGHRVCVAVRDLCTAAVTFAGVDVEIFPAPFQLGAASKPVRRPRNFAHILHNTGFGDDHTLSALTGAWSNLIRTLSPSAVVFEHAPTALLASCWFDVGRIILGTGFFSPPKASPLPDLRHWDKDKRTDNDVEGTVLERVNRQLQEHGQTTLGSIGELYAIADENFLLTFPELDHYPNRSAGEYFGMWSPSGGLRPPWPAHDGPRLFAYAKPTWGPWNVIHLISTLRELQLPTLAYVPGVERSVLDAAETPFLRFFTERLDADYIAGTCQAAFHHGNAGTATRLLLAGVPQLMAPLALEQEVFSRRLAETGAGAIADPSRPEQILMRLIRLVNSVQKREAAAAFARRHSAYDWNHAVNEIVERIERLAAL